MKSHHLVDTPPIRSSVSLPAVPRGHLPQNDSMDTGKAPRTHFQKWLDRKLSIARKLHDGELEGSYYDAMLIVSTLIAGFASIAWPRAGWERSDQRRFVKAWVKLSPPELGAEQISVPLLIADLERSGRAATAKTLRATHQLLGYGYETREAVGKDVDLASERVTEASPELEMPSIRAFSYGAVFYAEVRSGLVHEFRLGENAGDHAMVRAAEGPSYVNLAEIDFRRPGERALRRTIHFPFGWTETLVRGIAGNVEPLLTAHGKGLPRPPAWWLDGS